MRHQGSGTARRNRWRAAGGRLAWLVVVALCAVACASGVASSPVVSVSPGGKVVPTVTAAAVTPAPTTVATPAAAPSASLPPLVDGPLVAGRYVILPGAEGWKGDPCGLGAACPSIPPVADTLAVEITVPDGWQSAFERTILMPVPPGSTEGPAGAGFAIGWTTMSAGLHSDPCLSEAHGTPDIAVGPTVDDFVGAVVAHPALRATQPRAVELGGYKGTYLTISAPDDISGCADWRPWEPGFAAQGADNLWGIWVIDVEGLRMILVTEEFPNTSEAHKSALRSIVESIRFVP